MNTNDAERHDLFHHIYPMTNAEFWRWVASQNAVGWSSVGQEIVRRAREIVKETERS